MIATYIELSGISGDPRSLEENMIKCFEEENIPEIQNIIENEFGPNFEEYRKGPILTLSEQILLFFYKL